LVLPRPPGGQALYNAHGGEAGGPFHQQTLVASPKSLSPLPLLQPDGCDRGRGGILGYEMELGKILQTVTLVWTLLKHKQSPVAGSMLAKKVLIITPSSLCKNWEAEFREWLGL
jgi:hypothetical protein